MLITSPSVSNDDKFRKLIDMFNELKNSKNKIISTLNLCHEFIKS